MFKSSTKSILKTAIIAAVLGSTTLGAMAQTFNGHNQPNWNQQHGQVQQGWNGVQQTGVPVDNRTSAKDLQAVYLHDGSLEATGNGNWIGRSQNGTIVAHFVRVQLEANWLQLLNRQKGVYINIDLNSRTVSAIGSQGQNLGTHAVQSLAMKQKPTYGQGNNQGGGQIGQAYSTSIVNYSCNEGIPLVVRYENIGNQSYAYVSHDSLPEIKMSSVRSGSGSQYVSGANSIHSKGNFVYANFNGIEDHCYQD
ncbi:MAG: hypothetical protein AAF035_06470 [Pseudomonadota bacterium]